MSNKLTDQQILTYAAEAAGIAIQGWYSTEAPEDLRADIGAEDTILWSPIESNVDAAALADALGIGVEVNFGMGRTTAKQGRYQVVMSLGPDNSRSARAYRLAITRVAALMGIQKQKDNANKWRIKDD